MTMTESSDTCVSQKPCHDAATSLVDSDARKFIICTNEATSDGFSCDCQTSKTGVKGDVCNIREAECDTNPCNDPDGGAALSCVVKSVGPGVTCTCSEFWTGAFCKDDKNECDTNNGDCGTG